jgi:hypothetical protein
LPSDTFVHANRQSRGMSKLLQTCWLCAHMTEICSKWNGTKPDKGDGEVARVNEINEMIRRATVA